MSNAFRMPDLGEGLTEATVITWFVKVGDAIEVDQPLVEVDTGKTVVELPSLVRGTITSIMVVEGGTVQVDDILYIVDGDSETGIAAASPKKQQSQRVESPAVPVSRASTASKALAMPVVRKLARDLGIDLSTISGSGPDGVITRDDVLNSSSSTDSRDRVALSQTRRAIADHMAESWASIPHVTVQGDIRAERLLARRSERKDGSYPLEAIVAAGVIPLLHEFPEFNAAYADGSMAHSSAIHLGFAVDTEAGLIVVVVKDADTMDIDSLADEFERLSIAAQERTIGMDEISGQTFTISNIGALGGGHGTPIIPLGTSAIISIGRAIEQPVVENGELAIGLVAPLDLSYDHRLIDGALGQRFLSALGTTFESEA